MSNSSDTNIKDIKVKLKETQKHIPKKTNGNLYVSKLEIIYFENKYPKWVEVKAKLTSKYLTFLVSPCLSDSLCIHRKKNKTYGIIPKKE